MTSEPSSSENRPASSRAQEILAISAALFERRGYSATTITDIADAAGVLSGSLYHHFASKDAIAVALLEALDNDLAAVAHKALAVDVASLDPDRARAHLRDLTEAVVDTNLRHAAAVRLRAYNAPLVAGPALRLAVRSDSTMLTRAWSLALDAAFRDSDDRHRRTDLMQFTFQRLTLTARLEDPYSTDSSVIANQIYDVLVNGLLVTAPADSVLDASAARRQADKAIAVWRKSAAVVSDDKERILAAARSEFARHGYDASTIRGIAEAAGITMGTLYRRTESKEAILREILQRYSDHLDDAVLGLLSDVTSVVESLDALARLFVHASRRFSDEAEIVKLNWNAHKDETDPFHDYVRSTVERSQLLESVIAAGIREGSVRGTGTAENITPHFRQIMWLPYQTFARTSERTAHAFIRREILGGTGRKAL
ncbi:TetR family transcriptional regulator [Rhodococcoides yunnanense]|uniref:TetR family transcriptional regulator n=1 Tax=Rhodococcoides yunnanense TaxID=278209 RepID=UPI0009328149|nr:TetR/AcrR family transcriptional regulator [Rhodococcus yunnanensis]